MNLSFFIHLRRSLFCLKLLLLSLNLFPGYLFEFVHLDEILWAADPEAEDPQGVEQQKKIKDAREINDILRLLRRILASGFVTALTNIFNPGALIHLDPITLYQHLSVESQALIWLLVLASIWFLSNDLNNLDLECLIKEMEGLDKPDTQSTPMEGKDKPDTQSTPMEGKDKPELL